MFPFKGVNVSIQRRIGTAGLPEDGPLIIESDNCKAQYKSAEHFFHQQQLSNEYKRQVVRIYGVTGHGKGEIDHVRGIAKVAVRQEIANGSFYQNAGEVVVFCSKSLSQANMLYDIKEIGNEALEPYKKISSSNDFSFHLCIFCPFSVTFFAPDRY